MDAECKAIEKKIQAEVDQFKASQKDFSKLVQQRELLDGQLNENKSVLEELNLLKDDNQVYKLFGPVLVKQDLEESRQNVGKRMDYIKKELKRCNDQIEDFEKTQDKHRENIQKYQQKLQQQYQAVVAAAAMK